MKQEKEGSEGALEELVSREVPEPKSAPGELVVAAPKGALPLGRTGTRHGYHSRDAVEIPTSLTCNLCPLYHIKRKDRRHRLACREGRLNQVCPVLIRRQIQWAEALIEEVRDVTGGDPTASDRARIEQIIRHRSRIFQVENYLKVAGLIDLKKGEVRNVGDRLTTVENALSRSLSEFRQATGERRVEKSEGVRLEEYLAVKEKEREE